MTAPEHADDIAVTWRKASRSTASDNCVEIARTSTGHLIRDSKMPAGPWLPLTTPAWTGFLHDIKAGKHKA